MLPFGYSNTIVADLGGLKLFVYGGEVSDALASNGNRKMKRLEGLPAGLSLSAMLFFFLGCSSCFSFSFL